MDEKGMNWSLISGNGFLGIMVRWSIIWLKRLVDVSSSIFVIDRHQQCRVCVLFLSVTEYTLFYCPA